jgi:hypothetical protein
MKGGNVSVHRTLVASFAALLLVGVAPEANGAGGFPITSCGQMVSTSAFLTADLTCPGSDGVLVAGSGITIDLKGFTLRGDRSSGHLGIDDSAGFDAVTIKNGVVRNFYVGVDAENGADNLSVSNLLVSGNLTDGVHIDGFADSVKASNSSANGEYGIILLGSNMTIQLSSAVGNVATGILVAGGDSAKIQSATAAGNSGGGISVSGASARIKSSTSVGNGANGIEVGGNGAVVTGNRADANGFSGGASDLLGTGLYAAGYTTSPPTGKNTSRGNDDPAGCTPAVLC